MQTEERSICPSCGGDNPKAAAFCWRCFARMSPAPTSPSRVDHDGLPSTRLGMERMPSPPPVPAPPANGGPSTFARAAVGAAVALIAMFGVRSVLDRGPSLPDVLAGTPRITTQEMKDFEKQMIEDGKRSDLDVAAAGYGTGAVPAFVVVLVEGRTLEHTDDIFSEFVGGMTTGGATVETNATVSGERDGLEYRCVPVAAPSIAAGACMWRDDGSVGIVFKLDGGVDETKDLLFRTHDELA
jgi:hypothetical protein